MSDAMEEFKKKHAEMGAALEGDYYYPPKHNEIAEGMNMLNFPYEVSVTLESNFEADVWDTLVGIFHMLSEKNRKYGDAALNPARIFSKADRLEQLYTRVDDKLSRIANQSPDDDEDAVVDLIGYLILIKIAQQGQNDLH